MWWRRWDGGEGWILWDVVGGALGYVAGGDSGWRLRGRRENEVSLMGGMIQ